MDEKTIGDKIKEYRKQLGLTQVQLAKRLGITQGTLALYETGKRHPKIETVNRIADAICVSSSKLFDGVEIEEAENKERFYWVKIQYDDDVKCRHFQAPFVLFANSKEEAKKKIEREVPGKFSIVGVVELDKSLVFHPQDLFDIKAESVLWE
nr:MAG TPA: Repressor protein CI [Caudoviricetes sp.]